MLDTRHRPSPEENMPPLVFPLLFVGGLTGNGGVGGARCPGAQHVLLEPLDRKKKGVCVPACDHVLCRIRGVANLLAWLAESSARGGTATGMLVREVSFEVVNVRSQIPAGDAGTVTLDLRALVTT